jgi:electron transport complex protein RnfC
MIEKTRYIPDGKKERKNQPVIHYLEAEYLYFPTTDLRCPAGESCVVDGQYVKVGELIGTRQGGFFEQPIHSTVSGYIVGSEKKVHSSGQTVDCVIVQNDKKYVLHENCVSRTEEEIDALIKEDYIKIIKDSGLSGLGGSGFPSYIKLETKHPIHTVVGNGVECEPHLISDYKLILERANRIVEGLTYAMRATGAKKGIIAVKKKYPELYEVLENARQSFTHFDIEIKRVGNHYPAGWELDTIKSATGIKVPQGKLPAEYGVTVFNVATLYGFYRAVKRRMPITERFFSISGDGIKSPKNFQVRIGTPVRDLIALAGGYTETDKNKVLICGGPMMGNALQSDDIVVTKTATSLIVLDEEVIPTEPCIHCASCVYSCPVDLQPVQIMNAYKDRDKDAINALGVNKCIECGLCSFTCPSKIHLTETMRQAKRFIKK